MVWFSTEIWYGFQVKETIDGDNVDISESYLFPADELVKISYTVNKNNIERVFSDSVLIKRDKITDYQIEY